MSAALRTGNDNNDAPVTKKNSSMHRNGMARSTRLVLPAMAALGFGGPAPAFELGALEVQSTLGQPLRASIAYALNPGEEIRSYCIYLSPGRAGAGLPSAGPASVVVENGAIRVLGQAAVSDPLLALQVTVDCPYAAHLSREYVAFVDPVRAVVAGDPGAVPATRDGVAQPAAKPAVARVPIAASSTYRVQRGDTLSGIAQRLSGRRVTIWQAVDALFAANPEAFVDGNRDFLKAGALLRIPDALYAADGGAVVLRASSAERPAVETPAAAEAPPPASRPYSGYQREAARIESGRAARAAQPAPAAAADSASPVRQPAAAEEATPARDASERDTAREIRAGDGPFVQPVAPPAEASPAAILPDSQSAVRFEAPLSREPGGGAWSWLIWLGGSGIALILALLLLGRPLRRRFGAEAGHRFDEHDEPDRRRERGADPVASTPEPMPIPTSAPADAMSGMTVDFHVDEGPADARMIMVDGDGEDGSGFQDSGDLDVAQDFGFSASGGIELGLDVDFPEEPAAASDAVDTNIIPPMRRAGDVIVEDEIPPGSDETGAYDVSMIVDATQQPIGDGDDTTRDLHAIELETADTAAEEDPNTLSREVDYKILEQDYQEELTATQALNAELSHAARALVEGLEAADDAASPDAPTAEFPTQGSAATAPHPAARELAEADTVEMPAERGDDPEATGVNEALQDMPDDLPAAGNDATAEMEMESGTVERKKKKAS